MMCTMNQRPCKVVIGLLGILLVFSKAPKDKEDDVGLGLQYALQKYPNVAQVVRGMRDVGQGEGRQNSGGEDPVICIAELS
jgi:hypothetical protein